MIRKSFLYQVQTFVVFVVFVACGTEDESLHSKGSKTLSLRIVDEGGKNFYPDGALSEDADGESVWIYENGDWRRISERSVAERGLFILDMGDEWVPFIFSEKSPSQQIEKVNVYRKTFIGLANDKTDKDGKPLKRGIHNYLELYGIFPTLTVLKKRADKESRKNCFDTIDYSVFEKEVPYPIRYDAEQKETRFEQRYRNRKFQVEKLKRKYDLRNPEELSERKQYLWVVDAYEKAKHVYRALVETQKRLVCEGLLSEKKLNKGVMDWNTHRALRRFEKKHKIFGWGIIWKETRQALGRRPEENLYYAMLRMLEERVANQVPVIEDGTVKNNGEETGRTPRNLVREFVDAILPQIGWIDGGAGEAFLMSPPVKTFEDFKVAVKLPELPEYYSKKMKFSVTIQRGDVWYEFPYDQEGERKPQPRSLRPWIVLHVHHGNKKIALVQWPTTIGGWRSEMHKGREYWSYKNSPEGNWLWKHLAAAPVWFPPISTPPRDLVKRVYRKGRWVTRVKREEMGPGYMSAYGLVAAFHIQERMRGDVLEEVDHGIRTHGSGNYMSILRSHSHGCHRLYNHLAIRLHSFLLQRQEHERIGQIDQGWTLPFTYNGARYVVQLDTRGYFYRYIPPIPVRVTRGRIRGDVRKPIRHLVRKAGVDYPDKAEGASARDAGTEDAEAILYDAGTIQSLD